MKWVGVNRVMNPKSFRFRLCVIHFLFLNFTFVEISDLTIYHRERHDIRDSHLLGTDKKSGKIGDTNSVTKCVSSTSHFSPNYSLN